MHATSRWSCPLAMAWGRDMGALPNEFPHLCHHRAPQDEVFPSSFPAPAERAGPVHARLPGVAVGATVHVAFARFGVDWDARGTPCEAVLF